MSAPSPEGADPPELRAYWDLVRANPWLPDPEHVLRDGGVTLEFGDGQFPVLTLKCIVELP